MLFCLKINFNICNNNQKMLSVIIELNVQVTRKKTLILNLKKQIVHMKIICHSLKVPWTFFLTLITIILVLMFFVMLTSWRPLLQCLLLIQILKVFTGTRIWIAGCNSVTLHDFIDIIFNIFFNPYLIPETFYNYQNF